MKNIYNFLKIKLCYRTYWKQWLTLLLILLFIPLVSCDLENNNESTFHENELVSMVYMQSNNKSEDEIDKFSKYYQSRMNELEPDVLSWKFFRAANGKIILLERYKDEAAIFNHIDNVSDGKPMENDFIKFLDHFKVDSIEYYGQTSQEFKNTIESFGFPVSYKKIISGYSK